MKVNERRRVVRRRDRAPDAHKAEGEARPSGGLPTVARAVGSALGFFRRLAPKKRGELPRKRIAGAADRGRRLPQAEITDAAFVRAPTPAARSRAEAEARRRATALAQEIRRLEGEIDPLYHAIARGAGRPDGTEGLDALIDRSRQLKEELQDKRLELARLERRMARERMLSLPPLDGDDQTEPRPEQAPARAAAATPATPARLRQAVSRAIQRAGGADRSHKLIFDKTVHGLLDDDEEIRRAAAARLGELQDRAGLPVLEAALEDPSEKVRVTALNALAKLDDTRAIPLLERCVADASPHLRLAALRGLAQLEAPSTTKHLVAALEDETPAVRKTVATLLGWQGDARGVMPLVLALRDGAAQVRAAAAASLGALRDDRAVLPLIRLLAEAQDGAVHTAVQQALQAITGESFGVPDAKELSALRLWWIEARVRKTLERSGPPLDEQPLPTPVTSGRAAPPPPPRAPEVAPPRWAAEVAPPSPAAEVAPPRWAPEVAPPPEAEAAARPAEPEAPPPLDGALPPELAAAIAAASGELGEEAGEADAAEAGDELVGLEEMLTEQAGEGEDEAGSEGAFEELLPFEEDSAGEADAGEEGYEDVLGGPDGDFESILDDSLEDDSTPDRKSGARGGHATND